jgi:fibronectin type 3 domain-containing protein
MNDGGESAPSAPAAAEPLAPPPAPTGLKGRHGDGRVTIQWDPAPGATHYRLKRATDRSGPWDTIATTPRTTFADTGLTNGTTYFYMVRAANAGGKSAYSARLRATPLAPPAAPADLRAEVGDGEVTLSWSALPGALKYLVKRAAAPEGPFATVGRPSEPTFVDRGLRNRTVYYYSVSAVGATGEGATATASATPMTLPGAPEELTAAPGDGKVTLTWGAVADATAYQAERSLSPEGPYETVGTPTGPTWVDAGLENGITHFYRVIARNAGGDGLPSIVVQAVPAPPPPAPGGVRVTPRPGRVELAWDGWPTAERFRVKRSERAGGPYAVVGNPVAPTYVDYGVRNGTTYHYVVTAVGQAGESAPSAETPATPVAGAPTGNENVPTLEQFDAPIVGGVALAPGVDLERLMDLRRVEQLRELFDGTGQKFEAWEVAALIAREGHQIRRTLDSLLRLKSDGESDSFEAGALALFDRILAVRAQMGSLVRRLRAYLELLGLPAHPPEAVEIALSFVVSADKSRARAETWLENPEGHRPAAAVYFRKALEIARGYLDAMGKRGPARPVRPS